MEVHDEDRYNERNDGHGEEEQPQLMVLCRNQALQIHAQQESVKTRNRWVSIVCGASHGF